MQQGKDGFGTRPNVHEVQRRKSWWDKQTYGSGTYGFIINAQVFDPGFLGGRFTWNEIGFYATVTFVAWRQKDFRVQLTQGFLEEGLSRRGISSSGSIKRFKKKWIEAGYMRLVNYGGLAGNDYLVSDLLIAPASIQSQQMANWEEAHRLVEQARAREKSARAEIEAQAKDQAVQKARRMKEWARAHTQAVKKGLPAPTQEEYGLA